MIDDDDADDDGDDDDDGYNPEIDGYNNDKWQFSLCYFKIWMSVTKTLLARAFAWQKKQVVHALCNIWVSFFSEVESVGLLRWVWHECDEHTSGCLGVCMT